MDTRQATGNFNVIDMTQNLASEWYIISNKLTIYVDIFLLFFC